MIKISRSTDKDNAIKKFGKVEWPIADLEHYGKKVNYSQKEFVFKAAEAEKILGTIKGSTEAGILYVNYLIVAHDRKGKGIGRSLMAKAEDFGKKNGAHKAHLTTGKDWDAARFYESLGYKLIAILPKHHFKQDFVVYEKFL